MSIDEIIFFYKTFDKYKNYTYQDLYKILIHSFNYNQFKIFKDNTIYGYVNWAYFNQLAHDNFITTGTIRNWNCGNIITHIDLVAKKNIKEIYLWSRKNIAKKSITNNTTYLKITKNNTIRNKVTIKIR